MTYDDLNTLLDYHYWARDLLLDAVTPLTAEQFTRDLGNSFPSVRDTLAHLVGAEWVWHSRWTGGWPTGLPDPAGFHDLAAIRAEWTRMEGECREFLRALRPEGVSRVFEYKDFRGGARSSPFWQMLQHLVNHASYHRGQITTMLRQLGAAPPKFMDLIVFYRERGA
jgi:uncharacterized damage-inducible protein DinB